MAILDKNILRDYLITKYKERFSDTKITAIKLQKGLYFLYAFWGGKIRSQSLQSSDNDNIIEMCEQSFGYSEDLFDANFEAWAYGPVDREVYVWFKNLTDKKYSTINCSTLEGVDEYVIEYIDDLINKIFNTNDFSLVDLACEDKCWLSVYNPTTKNCMNNEAIKIEYAS